MARASRRTFTIEPELAQQARRLGINISSAARQGVADAIRVAWARSDHEAYELYPEHADSFWDDVEAWSDA